MIWFNYFGLIIMAVIMLPNIIWAVRKKEEGGAYKNRAVEIFEQIGRYGCLLLMVFNIPYTYLNFWFKDALAVYLIVNGTLCVLYLIFWVVCWKRSGLLKALSLSVLPTCVFLFSGIMLGYVPIIVFAVIFGICHIYLSCKTMD